MSRKKSLGHLKYEKKTQLQGEKKLQNMICKYSPLSFGLNNYIKSKKSYVKRGHLKKLLFLFYFLITSAAQYSLCSSQGSS